MQMATDFAEPSNQYVSAMYLGTYDPPTLEQRAVREHSQLRVLYAPNSIYRVYSPWVSYTRNTRSTPLSHDFRRISPISTHFCRECIHMTRSRWNTFRVDIIFVYNNLPNSTQVTENFDYECQTLHGRNPWIIDSHMAVLSQHTIPKKVPRIASKISL